MPKFEMVVQGDCRALIVELEKQLLATGIATTVAGASAFFVDDVVCIVEVFNNAPAIERSPMEEFGDFGLAETLADEIPTDSALSITVSMSQGTDEQIYVSCFVAGQGVFFTKLPKVREYVVMNRIKAMLKSM